MYQEEFNILIIKLLKVFVNLLKKYGEEDRVINFFWKLRNLLDKFYLMVCCKILRDKEVENLNCQ